MLRYVSLMGDPPAGLLEQEGWRPTLLREVVAGGAQVSAEALRRATGPGETNRTLRRFFILLAPPASPRGQFKLTVLLSTMARSLPRLGGCAGMIMDVPACHSSTRVHG